MKTRTAKTRKKRKVTSKAGKTTKPPSLPPVDNNYNNKKRTPVELIVCPYALWWSLEYIANTWLTTLWYSAIMCFLLRVSLYCLLLSTAFTRFILKPQYILKNTFKAKLANEEQWQNPSVHSFPPPCNIPRLLMLFYLISLFFGHSLKFSSVFNLKALTTSSSFNWSISDRL